MNYTIKQFLSAESFQNEGIDKQMPCSKVVCNLCLKDTYEENNKFDEIIYKNLNRRSQILFKKRLSLLSLDQEKLTNKIKMKVEEVDRFVKENRNKTTIFFQDSNKNILINPCKCDSLVHTNCILKWCVLNMSFQCSNCGKFINNIDFEEEPSEAIEKMKSILKVIFFIFSTIFLIISAIILFSSKYIFKDIFSYWQKILGMISLLIALNFLYYTAVSLKDCLRKRFSLIKFSNVFSDSNTEMTEEIKNKTINNFLSLYERRYQKSIEQLIEEKHNNNLFKNSLNLEIDKLRTCLTIFSQDTLLEHGVKTNNFFFGISVDKNSNDYYPLVKQTSSPSNYLTRKNNFVYGNPILPLENTPSIKLKNKKKKQRDNEFIKRRRSFQINFIINNKNRKFNENDHNTNQSNLVSEQNELIHMEKVSIDNDLKEKENI